MSQFHGENLVRLTSDNEGSKYSLSDNNVVQTGSPTALPNNSKFVQKQLNKNIDHNEQHCKYRKAGQVNGVEREFGKLVKINEQGQMNSSAGFAPSQRSFSLLFSIRQLHPFTPHVVATTKIALS